MIFEHIEGESQKTEEYILVASHSIETMAATVTQRLKEGYILYKNPFALNDMPIQAMVKRISRPKGKVVNNDSNV